MKKFVPAFIVVVCILGALSTQVKVEMSSTNAQPGSDSQSAKNFYEGKYNELSLKPIGENKVKLIDLKTPVVIINFWASWCTPCLKEFPSIKNFVNKLGKDKVTVFAINADDKNVKKAVKNVKDILKITDLPFSFVKDDGKEKIVDQFKVLTLPVSFVFINGKLVKNQRGEFDFMSKDFLQMISNKIK